MDRFIEKFFKKVRSRLYNLKSSMDRFIVDNINSFEDFKKDLKSSMDRFIVPNYVKYVENLSLFKIQYG